jgi:hypothetical protein
VFDNLRYPVAKAKPPQPGYSLTPLVKKLGVKPGTSLALVGAPDGFVRELVGLPADVRVITRLSAAPTLAVWFVTSRTALDKGIARMSAGMGQGLWIAWPKKASGVVTDLTEDLVRGAGLAHGLVDYKVCAINFTWSGLKFARRNGAAGLQTRRREPV